jgi:hypothetical protein
MAKPETGLRARIIAALRAQGWLVDSNPAGPATGPGRSDLTVCARGWFFAPEIKVPGEDPTPSQQRYGRKVMQAGGVWFIATSPEQAVWQIQQYLIRRRYP